jgi:hypothetical protein
MIKIENAIDMLDMLDKLDFLLDNHKDNIRLELLLKDKDLYKLLLNIFNLDYFKVGDKDNIRVDIVVKRNTHKSYLHVLDFSTSNTFKLNININCIWNFRNVAKEFNKYNLCKTLAI